MPLPSSYVLLCPCHFQFYSIDSSLYEFYVNILFKVVPIESADMYIVLVVSTQELPLVESLSLEDPTKPIIIFNLKLYKSADVKILHGACRSLNRPL